MHLTRPIAPENRLYASGQFWVSAAEYRQHMATRAARRRLAWTMVKDGAIAASTVVFLFTVWALTRAPFVQWDRSLGPAAAANHGGERVDQVMAAVVDLLKTNQGIAAALLLVLYFYRRDFLRKVTDARAQRDEMKGIAERAITVMTELRDALERQARAVEHQNMVRQGHRG